MGMEFEYDQSGTTSYIFLLSALVLYLGLATCRKVGASEIKQEDIDDTIKRHTPTSLCYEKQQQLSSRIKKKQASCIPVGSVLYWGAWVAFIALMIKVSTFEAESVYNPFEVLGLDENADNKEIKQKYRDLSKIYHPDRNKDDVEAGEKFIQINKAYEALTDEVTRANWEKYGNPDGRQVAEFGIALPAWIVDRDNSHLVIGAYVFVFMICLPTYIGCWWSNRTNYYSDDVMIQTMKIFGACIRPPLSMTNLIEKMSWCEEFQLIPIRETIDRTSIPKIIGQIDDLPPITKWKYPNHPLLIRKTNACMKSRALMHAHLEGPGFRDSIPPLMIEDLNFCLKRVPMLIEAMIEIISHPELMGYRQPIEIRSFLAPMHLSQMMIQACSREKEDPLMQIPHMTTRLIKSIRSNKISSIEGFYSISEDLRRLLVSKEIKDETKLLDIEVFGGMFPFLKVNTDVKVADEEDVTANSLVTVTVTLTRRTMSDLASIVDETTLTKKLVNKEKTTAEEDANEKARIMKQYELKNARKSKKPVKKKSAPKKTAEGNDSSEKNDNETSGDTNTEPGTSAGADTETEKPAEAAEDTATKSQDDSDADSNDEDNGDEADEDNDDTDDEFDWGDDEAFMEQSKKQQKLKEKKMKAIESLPVHCPYFPEPKQEWWWVFIGESTHKIMVTGLQKIQTLTDEDEIDVQFMAPSSPGTYNLVLYVVSDSYYGIDITKNIKLEVKKGVEPPNPAEEIESEDEDPFLIEESEDSDEDDFA